jgi:hypothetical protein
LRNEEEECGMGMGIMFGNKTNVEGRPKIPRCMIKITAAILIVIEEKREKGKAKLAFPTLAAAHFRFWVAAIRVQ